MNANKFEIGSRVYYKDHGSFDTGTITLAPNALSKGDSNAD